MHARLASSVFLALGLADLALLNLRFAPTLAAHPAPVAVAAATPSCKEAPPVPAPAPVPAPPPAVPPAPGLTEAMPDVRFEIGAEQFTSLDATTALARIAEGLRADPSRRIVLRGHTDRIGAPWHNVALSRRRAEVVARYLVARGAPADHIAIEAVGNAEPIDRGDTPAAWAENRRVQVLWR